MTYHYDTHPYHRYRTEREPLRGWRLARRVTLSTLATVFFLVAAVAIFLAGNWWASTRGPLLIEQLSALAWFGMALYGSLMCLGAAWLSFLNIFGKGDF